MVSGIYFTIEWIPTYKKIKNHQTRCPAYDLLSTSRGSGKNSEADSNETMAECTSSVYFVELALPRLKVKSTALTYSRNIFSSLFFVAVMDTLR